MKRTVIKAMKEAKRIDKLNDIKAKKERAKGSSEFAAGFLTSYFDNK